MFKNLFKKNNSFPPKEENVNVKEKEQPSFAGKIETVHDLEKVYKMEELLPNSKFLTDEEERVIMERIESETSKKSLKHTEMAIATRNQLMAEEDDDFPDFRIPDSYEAYRHPMDFYLQGTKGD